MSVESNQPLSLPVDSTFRPSVVVVGAGTAGLALAHRHAEAGGRALLLEKAGRIGGSLYLSTGMFSAGGTRRQRARGIHDSPEEHFADIMRISRGTVNVELTRRYCELAPAMVDFLDEHGFEFHPDAPAVLHGHEAYDRPRIYWGIAGGKSILRFYERTLQPYLAAGQVRIVYHTRAERLIEQGGRVVGVHAGDRDWFGPAVVLASGGYASSPDLFARFTHGLRLVSGGAPTSTGDGILMAEHIGARIGGSEFFLPSFAAIEDIGRHDGRILQTSPDSWEYQVRTGPQIRPPWEIWVNQNGERFCREDEESVDNRERALLRQPDMRLWAITDEAILNQAPPLVSGWDSATFKAYANEGRIVKRASTLDELAFKMQVPAERFKESVHEYNLAQAAGAPDPLGRVHRPAPIATPPFYALRLQGFVVRTWAGIAVDDELRVLRKAGGVFTGLYAVGEALGAATFSGDSFVAGMSIGPALVFGRVLGERLAA